MEKPKRWQFYLILAVILLTLYNILPTLFYYAQPLKEPVDAKRAETVALSIVDRVNNMEKDSIDWLYSFSKLLGIKPEQIQLKADDPGLVELTFANAKDAGVFKRFMPRAGTMIPFLPAQMELYPDLPGTPDTKVYVARNIDIHLQPAETDKLFHYSPKYTDNKEIAPLYRDTTYDRATQIALGFAGPSKTASQLAAIVDNSSDPQYDELSITLAKEIVEVETALGANSPITKRYFASFSQIDRPDAKELIQKYLARIETLKMRLTGERDSLQADQTKAKEADGLQDFTKDQQIANANNQLQTLTAATNLIQKNLAQFKSGEKPLTEEGIRAALAAGKTNDTTQPLSFEGRNPYLKGLEIDWNGDLVSLQFYPDVEQIRLGQATTDSSAFLKDKLSQFLINEIARASRVADESIQPYETTFAVKLTSLTNTQSLLTFDLGYLAAKRIAQLKDQLGASWNPIYQDLQRDAYPIVSYEGNELASAPKLGLVLYAPVMNEQEAPQGFRKSSLYIIARGMDAIIQKFRQSPNDPEGQLVMNEINQLATLLQQKGFIGYSGAAYGVDPAFKKDYIFELDDYYGNLILATRENFLVKGNKQNAVLDFTDVEQRILTENRIDDRMQEDLLKWKEEYSVAQVDPSAMSRYLVPAPTTNPYWSNLKLSAVKYFRGDDRKVIKWGLDLSGGKTVRIGLRDRNNRPVTQPEDLRQAVNELYARVNNMGVSERTIRIENDNIILDFPGSQAFSAAELIKASAMYFHIVNEKFAAQNSEIKDAITPFLQAVWNEAVVTNRKDVESINLIAWQHLGGASEDAANLRPISDAARQLYSYGLRLANPKEAALSHDFNDTLSSIALFRSEDISEWQGQTHPLIVIFHNYALDGSSLSNVQVAYDPTQGNVLGFNVKGSYEGSQSGSPRDDFYTWTSQFAEDKIAGTPKEAYTQGRGWRMAVVLNDKVISSPVLRAALKDGGTISGHFSQREVTQLAADLKAGSLSFTPRILSEENVSPELGKEERFQGILASLVALLLVIVAMVGYYHFAGVVASVAVLFNILILWGVLQNLGAALTLPGIAGIVLTIGMAVDANVLVFERIREEFKISGRIASAIQAGYRKAFSAIVDSNITTILAALILIQFDSGPIKGFAVTLIIGILASMFTALFMTRYFFARWVQNPNNKSLSMAQFFQRTNIDFLKYAKPAIIISIIATIVGAGLFVAERKTLFGMDFTGGYSLNVDLAEKPGTESYRLVAADALLANGATANDFQIRELNRPNQLRIQLGMSMEEKGHPFYQMPEVLKNVVTEQPYQTNPRIIWVVDALKQAGLEISPNEIPKLQDHWTVISGQLSDTMRNNAFIALGLALLSVLIYITFRFEFKYAVAAVVGLIHDVIITVGILAFLHYIGLPVQVDLQVIGAIMTIIGYSLNDTIIVFDRIREDLHIMRKLTFPEIINHALNVTLSRTVMTSGTTLLVLIVLVVMGGKSIFAFALVMTIGVLIGTFSSLFIASPVLLYLHNRELQDKETKALNNA